MQKENTIQELENISLDLYKDKPLELIPIGKKLISSNRHEKAIELFEFGLKNIIAQNNNNEFHIDCAKFNYYYADALIAKLFESNDLINNANLPAEEQRKKTMETTEIKENIVSTDIPAKEADNNNMIMDDEGEGEDEEESDDEDDDEKIAFQHLAVAEKTLKTFLEKYDNVTLVELSQNILNYYLDLSDVYFKFGELELIKSDFKMALEFFNQSLKIRNHYDTKYSRAIAETYFMMASACDADANQALVFYYKTYLILIHHLKKEKYSEITEVNLDFSEVNPVSLSLDKENLKIDLNDKDKVKELKETLNDIVTKIEDVVEEIKITKELITEKIGMKEEAKFTSNYDEKNVIDISKSGVIRKKNDIKSSSNKGESSDKLNN